MCNAGSCPNKSRTSASWLQWTIAFHSAPVMEMFDEPPIFCLGHCAPIQPCTFLFINLLMGNRRSNREICYYIATCTQNLQNFKETTHVTKHFQQSPNCPNHCHPFSPHDITIMPSSRDLRSFQFKVSQVAERCLQQNDFWDDRWPPYTDHEAVKKGGLPGELKNV